MVKDSHGRRGKKYWHNTLIILQSAYKLVQIEQDERLWRDEELASLGVWPERERSWRRLKFPLSNEGSIRWIDHRHRRIIGQQKSRYDKAQASKSPLSAHTLRKVVLHLKQRAANSLQ